MSNPLHNICVYIEDEAHLNEARELLERFNQPITDDGSFRITNGNEWNYLQLGRFTEWWLGIKNDVYTPNKITLTELQKLLEGNK